MLKRKLYLQIYGTIIASLLAVVIMSAIVFSVFGRDRLDQHLYELAGKMAWLTLPSVSAPLAQQQKADNDDGVGVTKNPRHRERFARVLGL